MGRIIIETHSLSKNFYTSRPVEECNAVPRPITEDVTKESECHEEITTNIEDFKD